MRDRLQAGKPSWYVTIHPGQLSLAIPSWVGAVSTSESLDINRHTARCTSPVSVVWQCKLVSGWGLKKRRSAPLYGPCGSGRTLRFLHSVLCCAQVYLHLLRLYLSTPESPPLVSFAEENDDQNALETNLAAAFRLLGEQANRIDTVQVAASSSSFYRVGGKTALFLIIDNLATVSHRNSKSFDLAHTFLPLAVIKLKNSPVFGPPCNSYLPE